MIVHICPSYKPATVYGGTTASVSKLCEALTAHRCKLQVLTTTANGRRELSIPPDANLTVEGVEVRYCRRLSKDPTHFSISLLWHLWRMIKNESVVVVHIHSWWNFTAIFSLLMTMVLQVPTVLSPRGMLTAYTLSNKNSFLKKCFHVLAGRYLLRYPMLHATSTKEREDIMACVKSSQVTVIPNLIHFPREIHLHKNSCTNPSFRLLFLSRIQEKKGLELLLDALKNLKFPWQLTIAGPGCPSYVSKLMTRATELGIERSLSWIGHIEDELKYQCLADHDLLLLPSYNENFGNVVLEALLSGTPVLISEEVGLSEYILQNKFGWVTSLNREHLVKQLNKAKQQEDQRLRIRRTAPTQVRADFSGKKLLSRYLQLYKYGVQR